MTDSWNEMKKAKENSYFDKKNREALERLKKKTDEDKPRPSPITGEPMVQEVVLGVVIDRCPSSKGIWLDAGELEELIEASKNEAASSDADNWVTGFFKSLKG